MLTVRHLIQKTRIMAPAILHACVRSRVKINLTNVAKNTPPRTAMQDKCNWVEPTCAVVAFLGLSLSFFCTHHMYYDPNCKCVFKK